MVNEYEKVKNILKELNYLENAKKYVDKLKVNNSYIENSRDKEFIGKKFNMLTILEKTDSRAKNRSNII